MERTSFIAIPKKSQNGLELLWSLNDVSRAMIPKFVTISNIILSNNIFIRASDPADLKNQFSVRDSVMPNSFLINPSKLLFIVNWHQSLESHWKVFQSKSCVFVYIF